MSKLYEIETFGGQDGALTNLTKVFQPVLSWKTQRMRSRRRRRKKKKKKTIRSTIMKQAIAKNSLLLSCTGLSSSYYYYSNYFCGANVYSPPAKSCTREAHVEF